MRPNASDQATQWALKKKEMVEKANRMREERKQNLANMGEMALGSKNNYTNNQIDFEKPRSSNSNQKQVYSNTDFNANYRKQFVPQQDILDQANYGQGQRQYSQGRNNESRPQPQSHPPPQFQAKVNPTKPPSSQGTRGLPAPTNSKPPTYEAQRHQGRNQIPNQSQQQQLGIRQNPTQYTRTGAQQAIGGRNAAQSNKQSNYQPPTCYEDPFDNIPIKGGSSHNVPASGPSEPLFECRQGCGRSFTQKALQKHEPICVKVFQKQRKQFDAQKHRIVSNEQVSYLKNQKQIEKKYEKGLKKSDWKKQSEAFRAIVKAAKGGKISQAQQNLINEASTSNLVQCQYCGRKFNDAAAAKHIPFCATKSKQQPRQPQKSTTSKFR